MTQLWILSDLHLRQDKARGLWKDFRFPEADICVIAGDICDRYPLALTWAAATIGKVMPVVMALGNHEFWGHSLPRGRREARRLATEVGVTLLDDSEAVIDGIRFVGATLWTDFKLPVKGKWETVSADDVRAEAMRLSKREFADFAEIYANEVGPRGEIARFVTPRDLVAEHTRSRAFLEQALATPFDGPTVVVSHHAPHPLSVAPRYAEELTTAGYVSDLTDLIVATRPQYWIHGHTHNSFKYQVADTTIICNPRASDEEQPDFQWDLVVEV